MLVIKGRIAYAFLDSVIKLELSFLWVPVSFGHACSYRCELHQTFVTLKSKMGFTLHEKITKLKCLLQMAISWEVFIL